MKVYIGADMNRYFQVGQGLSLLDKVELLLFLVQSLDIFSWRPYNVPGVDMNFIGDQLNVSPKYTPKNQKSQISSSIHIEAIIEEAGKLKCVGAIKKVFYPDRLANIVVVRKKTGKWRVCVDFTDLNNAYLKDPFSVPKIDQLVDARLGHLRMSFLDAF